MLPYPEYELPSPTSLGPVKKGKYNFSRFSLNPSLSLLQEMQLIYGFKIISLLEIPQFKREVSSEIHLSCLLSITFLNSGKTNSQITPSLYLVELKSCHSFK